MSKPCHGPKRQQRSLLQFGYTKKSKNSELSNEVPAVNSVSVSVNDVINPEPSKTGENEDELILASDISVYALKNVLSSEDRRIILRRRWIPDSGFRFPEKLMGKSKRSFQFNWFSQYNWLCYSTSKDAAFWKLCVAFTQENVGNGSHQSKGFLATCGFTNWKKALQAFNDHQKTSYHADDTFFSQEFLDILTGKRDSISQKVQYQLQHEIEANRIVMSSLIETFILCGRQNIPLRGHVDWGRISLSSPLCNDGNLRALLRFRAKAGDVALEHHLATAASNAMYTSAPIQNEIFDNCASVILPTLVKMINDAKCFTVLADETTDISTVEQLAMCVRYVHIEQDGPALREDFLKFVKVTDLTGEGLANSILQTLDAVGIELDFLRGQSYDRASAMSSKLKGVQARILQKYPKAFYTYCANHCLNLVLSDACSTQHIRNMIGIVKEGNNFFSRSALRKDALQKYIDANRSITTNMKGLIKLCETRWVERYTALFRFQALYDLILNALESIEEKTNDSETRIKAVSLQKSMLSFETIVSLNSVLLLLSLTLPASRALQSKDGDIQLCYERIMEITAEIRRIRSHSSSEFTTIFEKSKVLAEKLEVEVKIPRKCGRQANRSNVETNDPEAYFRQCRFIPFVDEFLTSLTTRFSDHASSVCELLNILPRYMVNSKFEDFGDTLHFYKSDLSCSAEAFHGEYRLWKSHWSKIPATGFPCSALETFALCNQSFYPTIFKLLKILCTLPISTATPKRTFSALRRLKTYIRNTMSEDRLNGLALLNIYPEVKVDVNDVLNEFKKSKRRIAL